MRHIRWSYTVPHMTIQVCDKDKNVFKKYSAWHIPLKRFSHLRASNLFFLLSQTLCPHFACTSGKVHVLSSKGLSDHFLFLQGIYHVYNHAVVPKIIYLMSVSPSGARHHVLLITTEPSTLLSTVEPTLYWLDKKMKTRHGKLAINSQSQKTVRGKSSIPRGKKSIIWYTFY